MTYIDIHILQSVPPSNINRDDTGSPKSAVFGGVRRARVSSQAWKRATRTRFNVTLDSNDIGYRTKRVVEQLGDEIEKLDPTIDTPTAQGLAAKALSSADIKLATPKTPKKSSGDEAKPAKQSGYLLFLSAAQYLRLAELAVAAHREGTTVKSKDAKGAINSDHSFDVSLFGRMVADDAELNVDAAAQVAHAISVHAVEPEFDYFTAVDDLQERDQETGAGMIGTVEFNSSTLYRYATLNIAGLQHNLNDTAATARAAAAFVESLSLSMPTGKQNTFANRTVPDAIVVCIRPDQPVNLVGAFETPVTATDSESIVRRAASKLVARHEDVARAYGAPTAIWVTGIGDAAAALDGFGEHTDIASLVGKVEQFVGDHLGERE